MKCLICNQGETREGVATVTLERGQATLVFKHVPAQVCTNCREEYIDDTVKDGYLNAAILGMSRQEIDKKFDEIVDFAEMAEFIATPVKRYDSRMITQPIALSETQCQSYTNTSV